MKTYTHDMKQEFSDKIRDEVFALFVYTLDKIQPAWYSEAWALIGLNKSEYFVSHAFGYLKAKFNRNKVIDSYELAREHAYKKLSIPEGPAVRGKTVAFASASILDSGDTKQTRAIFRFTRHWMRNKEPGLSREDDCAMLKDHLEKGRASAAWIDRWCNA